MDYHRIHIRYIHSGLYDSRRYEHVDVTGHKIVHYTFKLLLVHLAVSELYPRLGYEGPHLCSHIRDIGYDIIYIVDLSASGHLTDYRLTD